MKKKIVTVLSISVMSAIFAVTSAFAAEVPGEDEYGAELDPVETVSEEAAPEETVPEETVPEEAVSEETVPEEVVSEEIVLEETCGEKVDSEAELPSGDGDEEIPFAEETGESIVVFSTVKDSSAGQDLGEDSVSGKESDDAEYEIATFANTADTSLSDGFHQDPDSGDWYYYTDGRINTGKNSVIKDTAGALGAKGEWYYVVGGKVQSDFTGLANYSNDSGWWYITNGRVDRTVTTVAKNKNGWYYVKNGKVDKSYTGFAANENGSWYMVNGKLTRTQNTVIKDTNGALGTKGEWYYVVGGKVQSDFTGLANYSNASGWWYITNGKVDRSYKGLAQNKNGWYYLTNGKVDRSYTGFAVNENGSWYVTKGKLTRSDNTVLKDTKGVLGAKGEWYYVIGSKVQYSFTGLANYKNDSGWWYITNGRVDRSFSGIAKNKNGWYYLKNGKVDRSAGDYSFAANTSQIIDVQASGSTGTLILYNKNGNHFDRALSVSCYVGRNGITSSKAEGDGKTPSGVYTLGQAFGVASDPGCTRSYLKVNSNYYWVDDSTSRYYNQLVDASQTGIAWNSAEHLIDYTNAYRYAIAIDYNTSCTPYKGSAIFLHCSTGGSTSGCVAVSESTMIRILQSLTGDTRIYIH